MHHPPRPLPPPDPTYLDRVRWIEVQNANAADAPGGALLRVTGSASDGTPTVDQPNAASQARLLVAHPSGIGAGLRGLATADDFVPVAYDTADGTPAVGDEWGSESGGWKLRAANTGWRVAAPKQSSQDLNLVECWRDGAAAAAAAAVYDEDTIAEQALTEASNTYRTLHTHTIPETGVYSVWYGLQLNCYGGATGDGAVAKVRLNSTSDRMYCAINITAPLVVVNFPVYAQRLLSLTSGDTLALQVARIYAGAANTLTVQNFDGSSQLSSFGYLKVG